MEITFRILKVLWQPPVDWDYVNLPASMRRFVSVSKVRPHGNCNACQGRGSRRLSKDGLNMNETQ